jgi:Tfp pilus assembly protein PilN
MSGFNLLPEEFRKRRAARFVPLSVLVTLVIAVVGVLLMEFGVITRTTVGTGSMLRQTLEDRRVDLAQARSAREKLEQEIAALDAVLARTPVWTNVLIDVTGALSQGMWIEQWSADVARGVCSVRGRARDSSDVFALVARLEALEHFESVALAGSAKVNDEHGQGIQFEIVCRLRQAPR